MSTLGSIREQLASWIARTADTVAPVSPDFAASATADLDRALTDPRIRMVVCGEWNTGKSSLINALVGVPDLLPVDVSPCTSYITHLEHAATPTYQVLRDGAAAEVSRDAFLGLTAAKEGDATIECIRLGHPGIWPDEAVLLTDTPGLEDLDHTRSDITLKHLPQADVIVLLVDAVTGVKGTERAFVKNHLTRREVARVVCVLNKVDNLNEAKDLDRKLTACRQDLVEVLPDADWIPVCSRVMDPAQPPHKWLTDTGIDRLKAGILRIARRERGALLMHRFLMPARHLLDNVALRASTEDANLTRTLAEAEAQLADFRAKAAEAIKANERVYQDFRSHLDTDIRAWLSTVPDRMQERVDEIKRELSAMTEIAQIRPYLDGHVLDRRVAQALRQLADEFETHLSEAAARLGRDILGPHLLAPVPVQIPGETGLPDVQTVFRYVPDAVIQLVDKIGTTILLNPMVPGTGPLGFLAALLTKLGLGKLLKGIPLLGQLLNPALWVRDHLLNEVSSLLDGVPSRVVPMLSEAAQDAAERVVVEMQTFVERRSQAAEAGIDEARRRLADTAADVQARRKVLTAVSRALPAIGRSLEDSMQHGQEG